jgi:ketosteroid isomerase-like protein
MASTETRISEAIAESFSEAYPKGDFDTLRHLFHPDAIIWHNYDRQKQTVEENLAMATTVHGVTRFRYDNIRRCYFDGGFVQQHDVCGETLSGVEWAAEACIVFHLSGGRIVRFDEYLDTAQVSVLGLF